ncbi:MAG: hypothetical protein JSS89_12090 [Bacteroidetes bacterium]|nr:hypothetical protein [Bacteroidota bacterium]
MGLVKNIKFQKVHARRGRSTGELPAVSYKRSQKKITLRINAHDEVLKKVGIKHDAKVNLYVGEAHYIMIDLDENEGQFKVRGNKAPATVLTIETTAVDSIPTTCLPESAEWKELRIVEHEYVHVIVAMPTTIDGKEPRGRSKSEAGIAATTVNRSFNEVNKPRRGRPRKNV